MVLEPFGGGSPNARADRFRTALGLPPRPAGGIAPITLGSPSYLVGDFRDGLIDDVDLLD